MKTMLKVFSLNYLKSGSAAYLFLMLILLAPLLTMSQTRSLPASDIQFILEILPAIREGNAKVAAERQIVHNAWVKFIKLGKLSQEEEDQISALSSKYNINSFQLDDEADHAALEAAFDDLLLHIDIIPEKLVLAQAIIESAWGRSRFAKEANNFFGVHCYNKGCGIAPSGAADAGFEVKKYNSPLSGVTDYIRILNTNNAYKELRELRLEARKKHEKPSATTLATGLTRYSQKGSEYIRIINSVIKNSIPSDLNAFLKEHQK